MTLRNPLERYAADPTDPNYFYTEYVHLNLYRNDDGATSDDEWWEKYISGSFWNAALGKWDWKPAPYTIPDAKNETALFIAPFVLDVNDSNRILAGGMELWRTPNAKAANSASSGPEWHSIKPSVGSAISAICIADGAPDIVWVGHVNGEVYRTDNGTDQQPNWSFVGSGGLNPLNVGRYCTRIVVDAADHDTVYVTFGGYSSSNIWKTTDAGTNWHNVGGSMPEAPVRTLAIHPRNRDFLYAGTEVGVLTSDDGAATWSPTNEGPTNCSVYELFFMDETLVCVTHGRGMFTIDLSGV